MSTAETTSQTRSPYWHGMLCTETLSEIEERMHTVLDGNYFSLVIGNSYDENSRRFSTIEIYPSQRLMAPIRSEQRGGRHIGWLTQRLSMGVRTEAKTQAEGRDGAPHKYVHFHFEYDRVSIEHYAPAGNFLQWTLAVERHDEEHTS